MSVDHEGTPPLDAGTGTVDDLLAPAALVTAAPVTVSPEAEPDDRSDGPATGRGPLPAYVWVLVGAITVVGFLLRLPSFHDSLSGDEISTFYIVHGHSLGRVLHLVYSNQETTPPLYFIVAWLTKGLLSSPVQSIRLVSLACGTAAIPLTFLLGLWTVGKRAALVGAACVALSPYMIFFSTEARPYMLVLFFALVSTLSLLRALDTGRVGWWVAYAAASAGAAYSHYTVVFLLVAQFAWAVWTQPPARRALVVANVAAGLTFLPWLGGLRADLRAPNFINAVQPFSLHAALSDLGETWIGHPFFIPISRLPGTPAVVLAGLGLALGAVGVVQRLLARNGHRWRLSPRTTLIVVLALAPTVLVTGYSWARADILGGGNLIASWPGMAVAIGALVTYPRQPLRVVAVALTVLAYGIGGFKMLGSAAQRPNIDAALAYIDQVGTKGDPIVSAPNFDNPLSELDVALANAGQTHRYPVIRLGVPSLAEQLRPLSGPHPQPVFFGLPVVDPQVVAARAVMLARHGRVFLVSGTTSLPTLMTEDPQTSIGPFIKALPSGFHLERQRTFVGFEGLGHETVDVFEDTGAPR